MRRVLLALALLLGLASPAGAAWTRQTEATGTATATCTIAVTAGDLLVAVHTFGDATSNPTISDNAGGGTNTYTQIGSTLRDVTNTASGLGWWAVAKATETLTITIAATASVFLGTSAATWRNGTLAANPLRGTAGQQAAGTTTADATTSGTIASSAAVAGDLIVGYVTDSGALPVDLQYAAGTGYTVLTTARFDPGGSAATYSLEEKLNATGGEAATWTATAADAYMAFGAAFKPPVVAAPGAPNRTLMGVGR